MILSMIVAVGNDRQIGLENKMLWHIKEEFKHFKQTTMGHHIIMGRKTYDSIGRPLPGRTTVIVTRDQNYTSDVCLVCHSIEEAIALAKDRGDDEAFICGGASIYEQALPMIEKLYLTTVDYDGEADTFFPQVDSAQWEIQNSSTHEKTDSSPAWKLEILKKNS